MNQNTNAKKLAIVLPVYNTAAYLRECLYALANQTCSDFSVFAIDDGSSDGSSDILDQFAKQHSWIHVVHKKNGGASSARNCALDLIESDGSFEYVGFTDSDDFVNRHLVELVLTNLKRYQADYITFACKTFDKTGFLSENFELPAFNILNQNEIAEHFCRKESTSHGRPDPTVRRWLATRVFKTSAIKGIRFKTSLPCGEDQEYFFQALPNLRKGVLLPKYLYFYRLRKSSLSHSIKAAHFELKIYEDLYTDTTHFSESVRSHIERLLINAWWQETRQAYQCKDLSSIQNVKRIHRDLLSKQLLAPISNQTRRRLIMFSLGDFFLSMYFNAKNKNKSNIENTDFFD